MSFGFGTLACSTRADFAPKVIIILVAGLYNVLRETGVRRLTADETFDSTQATAVGDKERQLPEFATDEPSAGRK
jgi:hypothetical protein